VYAAADDFLAKFLGLYCIIAALAMMPRKQSAVAIHQCAHQKLTAFAVR
jgi:hypothetical protein